MSEKNSKTVVITGATGGIGTQICQWLLKKGYTVLAACRSKEKWNKFLDKLDNACVSAKNLKMVEVNLEDFDSIDSFVEQCKELSGNKIDILINNAGMIAPAFKVTKDGYESSIQVNYMAPVRITTGLTPCFSADSLVI
ncbi:MAG: SDR family NAD(P)-dependent oxidoreductase, partial [Bacteroidia bacterium]|nr:SDR family NAD(P)-dependent oxidoreductase [Bacteroidia bacterium]